MVDTVVCRAIAGTSPRNIGGTTPNTAFYTAAKKFIYLRQNVQEGIFLTQLPADLAGRQVLSATLDINMVYSFAGSRTVTLQRIAQRNSTWALLTWNNRPGLLAGSSVRTNTQVATTLKRSFDVTADLQAIALGDPFYGWKLNTTYNADPPYALWGWDSDLAPVLTVVLGDAPPEPFDISPDGITGLAAPVVTWQAPDDLITAQLQLVVDTGVDDPDFSSPLWDSGVVSTTLAQLDTAALGWAGQADGAAVIGRLRQTTDIGTSGWSLPFRIERDVLDAVTISSPASTTTDPTPTVAWSPAALRYRVVATSNGKTLYDSGVVVGSATALTPPKGATVNGQVITYDVYTWNSNDRTPSPGDPGYSKTSITTTYNPGAAAAITTLTATQVGLAPWVDLAFTRTAGVPDEWLIERNDNSQGYEIIARLDGTDAGSPVWSYRDWTCPPNTDVVYRVRPVVSNAAGAVGPTASKRTIVTGAWLFDPTTGYNFRTLASELGAVYARSAVTYEAIGRPDTVTRTFALRGIEGTLTGKMVDHNGRTVQQFDFDLMRILEEPSKAYRCAWGDHNIPVSVTVLTSTVHPDSTLKRIVKDVVFEIRQSGELPFEPITP